LAVTRRHGRALRWGGTLVAAAAVVALGVTTPPGTAKASNAARADSGGSGYDQMTGIGVTSSKVTVDWKSGLLDSSNNPITTDTNGELNPNSDRGTNPPSGELSFMSSDFENLQVTVSQTQNIGHGGVTVSWTWNDSQGKALPTFRSDKIQADFLQMMECYGDSSTGPSPEDCEFGGSVAGISDAPSIENRGGALCSAPVISTPTGVAAQDGGSASAGCDPIEPSGGPSTTGDKAHIAPCQVNCSQGQFYVPFVPVDPSLGDPAYNTVDLGQYFDSFNTNEVQAATTGSDGTGQQQFETDTFVQAPALGCGQEESGGQTQGCWLVIVPRGTFEPNGFGLSNFTSTAAASNQILTSPLSAANWAQRIQVHLSYASLPSFCPFGGTIDSPQMEGTQLITRAAQSWETALDQQSHCARIFHQTEVSEQQVTSDFSGSTAENTNGLAFTTNAIGSDRKRQGTPLPTLPNIVYAPVAVAGMGFGFHIDEFQAAPPAGSHFTFGYLTQSVKLTPQLAARDVTQSYRTDLPDFAISLGSPGPAWSLTNALNLSEDPVFQQLNPEIFPAPSPPSPFDTVDHAAFYQQIWNWIQGDPATVAWLDGTQSNSTFTADPDYVSLQIGKDANFDSMPRAYKASQCPSLQTPSGPETRCSQDLSPYVANLDAASAAVLTANPSNYGSSWNISIQSPTGGTGFWEKNAIEPPGQIFISAVDDTPSLAAYGIVPATLCDANGANCVAPTIQSVGAAVANAKADSAGLLEVNPANPGAGAYPLTDIIYAAVRTDEAPQLLNDYADFIDFAVNHGQTGGQAAGNLPAGYLPLPSNLVTQANAVVTKLRQIASGKSTPTPSASTSPSSGSSPTPGGPATATTPPGSSPQSQTQPSSSTPAATPNAATSPSASTSAAAAPGSTPTGPVVVPPSAQLVAGTTPGHPVGPVRNVIVIVFIIGLAGAGSGLLLRNGRLPRWPGRSRP